MKEFKKYFFLHLMLMIYSMSGIFSKYASKQPFLSKEFCLYYGGIILLLGFYAICWQQIIKRMPLTTAFANKAVTVIWGCVWGKLFFDETLSLGKIIGVILIALGVILFSISDQKEEVRP